MKTKTLQTVVLLVLSVAGTVIPGGAQDRARFNLNIPFEFVVGNHVMPAGVYGFEQVLGSTMDMDILLVRGKETRAYQAITTAVISSPDRQAASRLVFQRYGDHSFLSEIWIRGKQVGLRLYPSVLEKEVARTQIAREEVSLPLSEKTTIASARGSNH